MTWFAQTSRVAHIVHMTTEHERAENGGGWVLWQTECHQGRRTRARFKAPMRLDTKPIRYRGEEVQHVEYVTPTKPWCAYCVRSVREVAEAVGLLPKRGA